MTEANRETRSAATGRIPIRRPGGFAASEHALAGGTFGLLALLFLWAALVGGQMFSAEAAAYVFAPWRSVAPADVSHYLNSLLTDVAQYHYPWDLFSRQAIHAGVLPAWNPYALAGTPFLANTQTGYTTLLNIPLWVLPFNYGFGVVALAKLWVAAMGAYLLARELGLGFWPGLLAGISFSLSAFNVGWLGHGTLTASSVWMPWAVLYCTRLLREARRRDVMALAVVCALVIDGGHPGTELQVVAGAACFALLRAATLEGGVPARERLRRLGLVASGMVLGALLMAVVIVPVLEVAAGTAGQATRSGGGYLLPGGALRTAMFPGWWGRPSEANYLGPVNYVERTIYGGTVALLLAGVAVSSRGQWRRLAPFAFLAVVGPAVAVGAPVVHGIAVALPGLDSVQDARLILWFPFAVSMMGAVGMQALLDRRVDGQRQGRWILAAAVGVAAAATLWLGPSVHEVRTAVNHFRTATEYHQPVILALTAIGWWLIIGVAVAGAVIVGRRWRAAVAIGLVVVAAGDMYHFAHGFQPTGPESKVVPPLTPGLRFLERNAGGARVVGVANALAADADMSYRLRDAGGSSPPEPTLRYFRLWSIANPTQAESFGLVLPSVSPAGLRVLSLLATRYIATDPGSPASAAPLPVVYRGSDLIVYGNPGAVAPAYVPPAVRAVGGEQEALAAVADPGFDARREALVETRAGVEAGAGTVAVQRDEGSTVGMSVELTRGGLVVLNDAWSPGWSATIDGRPAPVLRVNDVMRGLDVPRGRHVIAWHYRVPGLRPGVAVSLTVLLGISAWAVSGARRRHRRPVAGG